MTSPQEALSEYVTAVTRLVDSCMPTSELVEAIKPLKSRLVTHEGLVPDVCHDALADVPYTRNLLHADPEGRFTVMAVVWGAGRSTPVHDHETWGVVGGYCGTLDVTDFCAPCDRDGHLEKLGEGTLAAGEVCCIVPPRTENIHQMANRADRPAVSIHTYGDPAKRCRIYDPASGKTADRELGFHNVL